MNQKVKVAIGLGANLGDRLTTLSNAARALTEDLLEGAVFSSVYESPPWGIKSQPDFLNAIAIGESEWKPPAILSYLKSLETELGRIPGPKYGPRHIDLDLIAYGEMIWQGEGLDVPHPRLAERDFVLLPLKEVWPNFRDPRDGRSVEELIAHLASTEGMSAKVIAPPLQGKVTP